jgi:hypothetical protein
MPIHSICVDLLLHNGSARNASFVLNAFAVVMALVLPIKRNLFFVDDVIGLALPTNLLKMDGLKRGGEDFVLVLQASVFSTSSFFGSQFPWLKFTSFCLPFKVSFGLIVITIIALHLHRSASVLLGLRPSCLFRFHGYAMNCGGVSVCT